MRILNVITRLNIGGASPVVMSLVEGFQTRGHESVLVAGTPEPDEGTLVPEARRRGLDVIELPELRRNPKPIDDARALAALIRMFRQRRPDVVMTHMSKAGALGRIAARVAGVRAVHTYHGKGFGVFSGVKRTAVLAVERRLAAIAAGSIVVSEIQRREFIQLRVDRAEKIRMIHYGVDLAPFVAAGERTETNLRRELGLPADTTLVGVMARVVAIKGQDVLIRAVAKLKGKAPSFVVVIAGDGDAKARFEALAAELGVNDIVRFLGWRRDVADVLASLDLVVLPTTMDFEGVPVAVIEAQAVGRPIVATDVGGVAETVIPGKTGWLVPPRDVDQLAAAIADALSDRSRAESIGKAGQAHALKHFALKRYVDETESYLAEIAR